MNDASWAAVVPITSTVGSGLVVCEEQAAKSNTIGMNNMPREADIPFFIVLSNFLHKLYPRFFVNLVRIPYSHPSI
jgi:hypothetical protein